jgi:hypothetical protein
LGQKLLEAFTLNEMSSNLQIEGIKGRSFSLYNQIYPPVDGCFVGRSTGGPVASSVQKSQQAAPQMAQQAAPQMAQQAAPYMSC